MNESDQSMRRLREVLNGIPNRSDMRGVCSIKHGHASEGKISGTYRKWASMLTRCGNEKCNEFANYGGRGIFVCEEWKTFQNFLRDMGECPKGMTLDRIDSEKGYNRENCRWTDMQTQQNNRRNNHRVMLNGEEVTIAEASRLTGICQGLIQARINRLKWTPERAVTTPSRGRLPNGEGEPR